MWKDGQVAESPFLPASEFALLLRAWVNEYNRLHPHTGRGMNGRAPLDVMDELLPPAERTPVDIMRMEEAFWAHKELSIHNGQVMLFGEAYIGANEFECARLLLCDDTKITVAYDPDDVDRALAISGGQIIARLEPKGLVDRGLAGERDARSEAAIAATLRRGRSMRKRSEEFWQFVSQGVPTMLDGLRQRAGLPAAKPMASPKLLQATSNDQLDSDAAPYVDDVVARMRAASGRKA
jgi:hypothetical protein